MSQNGMVSPADKRFSNVVLLSGGRGPERAGSLVSGQYALEAMRSLKISARTADLAQLCAGDLSLLRDVTLVFLTTHGWYGEDGKVQGLLDCLAIPYIGSGVAASAAAYYKPMANQIALTAGLNVPPFEVIDAADTPAPPPEALVAKLGEPVFAKHASNGGSQGAQILRSHSELANWLAQGQASHRPTSMVCSYIAGIDISVGIIETDRDLDVLPILGTTVADGAFYSNEIKREPTLRRHECPLRLSPAVQATIEDASRAVFRSLGCAGFARVDFILDADETPWFLEVNTLPGLSKTGNLAQMAYARGWSYEKLIETILLTAPHENVYRP